MTFRRRLLSNKDKADVDLLIVTTIATDSAHGLVVAMPKPSGQARRDETLLDAELKGEIDMFVIDEPEVDLTEHTLICRPPYDIFPISQEMTEDKLKYIYRF